MRGAGDDVTSPRRIRRGESLYPTKLERCLALDAPPWFDAVGDLEILRRKAPGRVALFCSLTCPGRLILRSYDAVRALREAGVTVVSGFHSPVEREALTMLLRGTQPVVVCPARTITPMRLPAAWRPGIDAGRLVVVSPFDARYRRPTEALAWRRNAFAAALTEQVLIVHASAGSRMLVFAEELVTRGTPVLCLEGDENGDLVGAGAKAVSTEALVSLARSRDAHTSQPIERADG